MNNFLQIKMLVVNCEPLLLYCSSLTILDNPYTPVQPQRAQGMSEIIFNTRREFSCLQAAMKCFTYCINTNEIPNHFCERCNLLCNHSSTDLFTCEDIMFLRKSSLSWYFICVDLIKILI